MIITKTCNTCEHSPNDHHCVGCVWDEDKGENTKWELKNNPIVIERKVLDKIRGTIQTEHDDIHSECKYEDGWSDALKWVLDIIDEYRNEVSK